MLEIKNVEVHGLDRAIVASGNPMTVGELNKTTVYDEDFQRATKLGASVGGMGHDNFLKGIIVQFDVKYPQYWTPEAQRYHWLDIVSSQSKMHRLTTVGKDADLQRFFNKYVDIGTIVRIKEYIEKYNTVEAYDMKYFWFMKALSNLPMGYEMWETISTNYLQLKTIYKQRKNHKLKEDWGHFINMCDALPMFLELIGEKP